MAMAERDSEKEPNPLARSPADLVRQVEARIIDSSDPELGGEWTRVRGELVQQDQHVLDRQHSRRLNLIGFGVKSVLSVGVVGIGVWLISLGHTADGAFVIGIGIAPILGNRSVLEYLKRMPPGGNESE